MTALHLSNAAARRLVAMFDPLAIETGDDFRAWREASGFTVRGLAATLGVSRSTVERWQRGEPAPPRIAVWALLGVLAQQNAPEGSFGGDSTRGRA